MAYPKWNVDHVDYTVPAPINATVEIRFIGAAPDSLKIENLTLHTTETIVNPLNPGDPPIEFMRLYNVGTVLKFTPICRGIVFSDQAPTPNVFALDPLIDHTWQFVATGGSCIVIILRDSDAGGGAAAHAPTMDDVNAVRKLAQSALIEALEAQYQNSNCCSDAAAMKKQLQKMKKQLQLLKPAPKKPAPSSKKKKR